jgi:transcriptional regulator with XRE-family HTH domain
MITAPQLRAARALLGIDQQKLADLANVSLPTIQRMEASPDNVRGIVSSLMKVLEALDKAGLEIIGDGGAAAAAGCRFKESSNDRRGFSQLRSLRDCSRQSCSMLQRPSLLLSLSAQDRTCRSLPRLYRGGGWQQLPVRRTDCRYRPDSGCRSGCRHWPIREARCLVGSSD